MEDRPHMNGAILKSLMVFANTLLTELGEWCQVSTDRDLKTIAVRVEHEGLSFLTITLPSFGKSFEKSLDQGRTLSTFFDPSFGFKGGVPRFLGGFLERVFDAQSGVLLSNPDIATIRAIRQFSLAFAKIGVDCSNERTQKAISGYLQCEWEVRSSDQSRSPADKLDYGRMASRLWSNLLSRVDARIYNREFLPRHGPGATADGLKGNFKFLQSTWPSRLESAFPFGENAVATYSSIQEEYDRVNFLEPGAEIPVKVITVPKTLKTPRIIAVEPTAMQYMQQAIHEVLQEEIREDDFSRNFLCYDDQTPNQRLARQGSRNGDLATLDLSEASDRVSNEHVRQLLAPFPHIFEAVDATRSRKAHVFGKTIRLAKFASMGSALCFPMEALVFTTIVFIGIQRSLGHQLSLSDIRSLKGRVRVYGDDIIVPVDHALAVKETLESFGFKVNSDKSFWTGKFRESCGRDYYDGYDVSVVRVRSMLPNNRHDVTELVKTVSLRNHLAAAGYDRTVGFLDDLISSMIPFPKVGPASPVLGRVDLDGIYDIDKIDVNLQIPLVKGMVVKAKLPERKIDGNAALLKWFLKRGREPFADRDHLLRSGRPVTVSIKSRMARSY